MATNQHRPPRPTARRRRAPGAIDTVLAVFADHQGRLVGKRTDGEFFFDTVLADGTENCDYLIACDLDNKPIPGFRWASYDQGYGDMRGVVDPTTIRYLPWHRERRRWCSSTSSTSTPARRSRCRRGGSCSARWTRRPTPGYVAMIGSEIEFFLFKEGYDDANAAGYRDAHAELAVPRGLPHPADDQGGGRARRDPPRPARRRVAGRVLQGRGRPRPARGQPHVPDGRRDGRHQPAVQERR